MRKLQWIVFDVGGVLLDWPASSMAAATYLGVTHDELFDVLFDQSVDTSIGAQMNVGAISAEEGWRLILEELKKDCAPEIIINRWYAKEFWLEDTLQLIVQLHEAGYKLAIMSNSWLGLTDPRKRRALPKELRLFDKVFDSSVERLKKPDEMFYELVEQSTGSKGDGLFFIDDDQKNLAVAEKRGWQHFLYEMGEGKDGKAANAVLRDLLLDPR